MKVAFIITPDKELGYRIGLNIYSTRFATDFDDRTGGTYPVLEPDEIEELISKLQSVMKVIDE